MTDMMGLHSFQGGANALMLGEEFHHNRITVVCSQISGVSRRLDHRWNELRLAQTLIRMCAEGRVQTQPLVSHVLPSEEAGEAPEFADFESACEQYAEDLLKQVCGRAGDISAIE